MPMPQRSKKHSLRRQMGRVRAAFSNETLAMDARALGRIHQSIALNDIDGVRAALSYGGDDVPSCMTIQNGVAIIPVVGTLRDEVDWMVRYYGASCYQVIERDIKAALDNSQVKAVVLWCNSPGGQAIGVKRTADAIYELRGSKKIVAYVQGICGSACYYLAAACDRIEATADSMVGSIGTIYTHAEISGMAKQLGWNFTVITNEDSPKKGHGNMYEPLSKAAKETLQGFVNSYGEPFINDVARYRSTTAAAVIKDYGQGDAFVGTEAKRRGMVDAIVSDFAEVADSLSVKSSDTPIEGSEDENTDTGEPPVESRVAFFQGSREVKKIKAQLFAMGLIQSIDASDEVCTAAMAGYFAARGQTVPADEAGQLAGLQNVAAASSPVSQQSAATQLPAQPAASNVQQAHQREQQEAREAARTTMADLRASASLINKGAGRIVVTDAMVIDAFEKGLDAKGAVSAWNTSLSAAEPPVASTRVVVTSEGQDRFAADAVDALLFRATSQPGSNRRREGVSQRESVRRPQLSDSAMSLTNRPLWAIAAECLAISGQPVDMYGDRESICLQAMEMGNPTRRHTFFSTHEHRQYIGAAGVPYTRPADFPNILSNLANKFLDSIELDEWTYPEWTAVLPQGLGDFKPAPMMNHGTPDELDEVLDSSEFNELSKSEEVLSYIFCRRFGNKWGWTPVLMANDDLGAFVEGMLGLDEAWQTTQHRLCLSLLTGNPTLLDGYSLFGTTRTQGTNDRTSGGAPSDDEWAAMETVYADVKGVGSTTRRVRGSLDTILVPTGAQHQAARRTFMPLNAGGLENKVAATTANVGLYRGLVNIIPEPELRDDTVATRFYGMRNPTGLRTATIVRGYFNGYGAGGKRERWYDPDTKTTWVSIEGRIGTAIKNWRYVVRNKGAA